MLATVAHDHLKALAALTNETAHLAVRADQTRSALYSLEHRWDVRRRPRDIAGPFLFLAVVLARSKPEDRLIPLHVGYSR